jgi:peroxiredoxin
MKRTLWLGCFAALCIASTMTAEAPPAPAKAVENFQLPDARTGKQVSLAEFKDRKAVVVVFLGTACPISNAQLAELIRLHAEYAPKGVHFLGINSNHADKAERVARHAKENDVPFPVLKDEGAVVADLFGATRTPEAFVLDSVRAIRYRGRVNDRYDIDVKKLKATTRELGDALDAVLAGKEVAVAATSAPGCKISRAPKPKATGTVTFTKDVCRILQKHCQECHRPGQPAPMSLVNYDEAADWSATIRDAVGDRRMPPWYADPKVGHFSNDRSIPAEDNAKLLKWIDEGCPKGDDRDQPSPLSWPADEWKIGKPDLVLSMEEEYAVPAEAPKGGIPYQFFIIDPKFKEDMWVQKAEARPGAPSVVHHILAFIVPPRDRIDPDMPSPPFIIGVKNARVLTGTAPGDMPRMHSDGLAVRIPAGSKIILQLHYTPNGKAEKDRSRIAMIFAKKPPEREVMTIPIYNFRFRIPPGAENHRVESSFEFKEDGRILAFMPHMHLRGKDFAMSIKAPDGKEEPVLSIPRYNFNWQLAYNCAEPVKVPKGGRVLCVAHYDNSEKNPNNPDPKAAVYWGEQTWQEMMVGWIDMYYDRKPKEK